MSKPKEEELAAAALSAFQQTEELYILVSNGKVLGQKDGIEIYCGEECARKCCELRNKADKPIRYSVSRIGSVEGETIDSLIEMKRSEGDKGCWLYSIFKKGLITSWLAWDCG